jgi:hypothetical protein
MDGTLKQFMESGKHLIQNTRLPKQKPSKVAPSPEKQDEFVGDAHQVFVRRTKKELPKKLDIVEELKKFIKVAEADI